MSRSSFSKPPEGALHARARIGTSSRPKGTDYVDRLKKRVPYGLLLQCCAEGCCSGGCGGFDTKSRSRSRASGHSGSHDADYTGGTTNGTTGYSAPSVIVQKRVLSHFVAEVVHSLDLGLGDVTHGGHLWCCALRILNYINIGRCSRNVTSWDRRPTKGVFLASPACFPE